jgi:pimeloyl-ACP methyl ester carboxylesterase/flavin-dependent dehydrogenase
MPPSESLSRDEAVVIGGSMAGMLAARALADHFDHVTVVDRDRFPQDPEFRPGVPQSRHLHVLLARGLDIAERLFPGIAGELIDAGATPLEWPTDAVLLSPRGWSKRFAPGIQFVSCRRELLEWTVRRSVAERANVRLLEGQQVTGLVSGGDRRTVRGVRLRAHRPGDDGGEAMDELHAGLVVDASGRHSKGPEWLASLGYEPPREERVSAFLGYASRDYAIPPGFQGDWKAIMLQAKPPKTVRTGYLFQVAPDRWRLSVMGAGHDYPPTDQDGFLDFVRGLRSQIIYETIDSAEPLTPVFGYRETENQRRFYERLSRFPDGFLVTGDAVAAFNPIYGQGMTAAAQSALVLDQLLREGLAHPVNLGYRFQRAAARANAGAWLIATGEDLRYPATEGGKRDLSARLTHRYLNRVFRAATDGRGAHFAFVNVVQLVDPPIALLKPAVLVPALLRGGRPDRAVRPEPPLRGAEASPHIASSPIEDSEAREVPSVAARAPLRTSALDVDGVRSPLLESGPQGVEEAVVFVHGNPGSSLDWADLARAVGVFGRAVALDMPGFGRADKPDDFDYTVEGYAQHLGHALEALGVRRAHLVLHDFGGPWGLTWAIAHPEAFGSVTFINIGLLLDYRWHYLARIWRTPLLGELFMATTTRSGVRLLLKHGNPRGLPRPVFDRMYDDFDRATRRAVLKLYRATGNQAATARRMAEALRQMPRPALVVWGKHDPYVPVALATRQREVFPDAEVVILEGSGHWPFADDPEGVARVVVPFLRRVMDHEASGGPRGRFGERSEDQRNDFRARPGVD